MFLLFVSTSCVSFLFSKSLFFFFLHRAAKGPMSPVFRYFASTYFAWSGTCPQESQVAFNTFSQWQPCKQWIHRFCPQEKWFILSWGYQFSPFVNIFEIYASQMDNLIPWVRRIWMPRLFSSMNNQINFEDAKPLECLVTEFEQIWWNWYSRRNN